MNRHGAGSGVWHALPAERRRIIRRGAPAAFTLAVACAAAGLLKLHYHHADFDGLRWILAPTTWLVQVLSGVPFELEPHHGFLSRTHHFEIVPVCAGVNFMIVAFLSVVAGLGLSARSPRAHAFTLVSAMAAAYLVTLVANSIRIAVALHMHATGLAFGPLTPDRLHRIEGVVVYFTSLCGLFLVAQRIGGEGHAAER